MRTMPKFPVFTALLCGVMLVLATISWAEGFDPAAKTKMPAYLQKAQQIEKQVKGVEYLTIERKDRTPDQQKTFEDRQRILSSAKKEAWALHNEIGALFGSKIFVSGAPDDNCRTFSLALVHWIEAKKSAFDRVEHSSEKGKAAVKEEGERYQYYQKLYQGALKELK